jgi:hypothetical protein
MKLVTVRIDWSRMDPEYVPGRCNIGTRGRAIRLSTGAVLIGLSVALGLTVLSHLFWELRLLFVFPTYIGLLAILEGSTSFCVLHAARGTYDLHEPMGFATSRSRTLNKVGSGEWKMMDRRKARRMHAEALAGAIVLTFLLALA